MTTSSSSPLHLDVLPPATLRAFEGLSSIPLLKQGGWYLAGGTALALQVGHRQSVDLDFFRTRSFQISNVERSLFETGEWITSLSQQGTLYGVFKSAKASFIAYPFFKPSRERIHYGTISILTPPDIAAMKVIAISQRGKKRDFIDLYWYCTHVTPLEDVMRAAIAQYPNLDHNVPHFLKSLVYFEDAESDPMPNLFFKADWKMVKAYFQREVPTAAKKLLQLE